MVIIALSIPTFFQSVKPMLGLPPRYGFPLTFGSLYAGMFFLFDKWVWRAFSTILGIPNLNGKWKGTGRSSYEDPTTGKNYEFTMDVTIKQTFSAMEVFTQTGDSTSRSTMASLCTQHAVPIFRYAYENAPKNMANAELQRHPGLIELRIEDSNRMSGDYFSGKHRLRFGELTLERQKA